MGLRINQNIAAQNAYRNLSVTDTQMGKSLEKLSSGFRINRAADDAAGLAISEGLRSQVGGLKVGARNAQDGISVVQTAEGALTEVHSMLQRMNDLSVQYNSGVQNTDSKAALQGEFDALNSEITRIQQNTTFNGVSLFAGADMTFQVGFGTTDTITVDGTTGLADFTTATSTLDITAATNSDDVQKAITSISTQRASLGALQNRFEHTVNSVNVAVENLSASESRIRDTDMAQEMMSFTRSQILSQAGTAMLAQANQSQQGVLSLLR
ncbi:flagellin [Krasilnikovia sp. MM14-A1259]|uniref:flagellin N-terminal helical domain-containing protein n=1 Tax=Krasilnikovia sp. MM14-A1259 TaxID=3373539 RepID=UPI0037F5E31F